MNRATLADLAGLPPSFYDGAPGRTLTACPDCGQPADELLGGDHGGQCVDSVTVALPGSALAVVRALALGAPTVDLDVLARRLAHAGVHPSSARPAVRAAGRRGWLAPGVSGVSLRSKIAGQRPLRDRAGR